MFKRSFAQLGLAAAVLMGHGSTTGLMGGSTDAPTRTRKVRVERGSNKLSHLATVKRKRKRRMTNYSRIKNR